MEKEMKTQMSDLEKIVARAEKVKAYYLSMYNGDYSEELWAAESVIKLADGLAEPLNRYHVPKFATNWEETIELANKALKAYRESRSK